MRIVKKHIIVIIISTLIATVGVICSVVPYFFVADMITDIANGVKEFSAFSVRILLIFLGLAGGVIFHKISTVQSHRLAFSIIADERKALTAKLNRLPMGTIEKKGSGIWARFMVESLEKIEPPIAHVIPEVFANIMTALALMIIVFFIDWRIGIANLLTVPLGILFSMLMMSNYEERSRRYIEASKNMNATMVEYIQGIRVIKAFNKTASSYKKFQDSVEENKNSMLQWYLGVCFSMTAAMEILPSTQIFVLPFSMFLFMNGEISVSSLITCILICHATYHPLIRAMVHTDNIASINVVIQEIEDIMNLEELDRGSDDNGIDNYDIEFKNVVFGYEKDKKVFGNLSFVAEENQLTAIVGYSGGGKSTIAKLIAGFWNVDEGEICIGGRNIRNISLAKNMQLVTYVSQENYLFDKSIIENMRMAKADVSIEEIQEACKKASCHDFISSLENAYETVVGEAGTQLSGGERQRITIARALLKNSPIVVLDEATAYSDPDNEAQIQKSIDALVKNKTVIMIAHRLSTIMNADKIVVMDKGKIAEEGRHSDLLNNNGIYKDMWDSHKCVVEEDLV